MPDWTSSRIPNGSRIRSRSAILAGLPITWTVTASVATSTTLARNSWTTSRIWPRVSALAATLTSTSSRWTDCSLSSSTILITSTSLFSCLVTCSSGEPSTLTTIVIREISACSVGPTASDSMLKPRLLNRPAILARTPGWFSTRTDRVWLGIRCLPRDVSNCLACSACVQGKAPERSCCRPIYERRQRRQARAMCARSARDVSWGASNVVLVELRGQVPGVLDVIVAGAGRHHRPHHRVTVHPEVDDDRDVVDLHRLGDRGVDVLRALAGEPDTAVGVGQLDEVGDPLGVQVGVGVPLVVEQRLPLPDHAQRLVVDDRDLDRDLVDRAGGQLLVGHLEAAVAVDRPHDLVGAADLGAHRGWDREAHRPEAAGVDPPLRLLVVDVVGRPHLVLA